MTPNPTTPERAALARHALRLTRRGAGDRALAVFSRIYLAPHFALRDSPMHKSLFSSLESIAGGPRGARLAVAAPRGHAKSTVVSLAYVLWCVCYKREPYVVLVSNTASQANDLLTHVKRELEANPLLQEDFPEVCEPHGSRLGPPRWREDDIITQNGVRVSAFGAEKKIRGRRHGRHRPSLVILDDVENEEMVRSAARRQNLLEWFEKAVLKAGDHRTNVVVVGTILHYDSLLARLVNPAQSPGWQGMKYRAVLSWASRVDFWERWERTYNHLTPPGQPAGPAAARAFYEANRETMLSGAQVLWAEKEDYYALMEMRLREGAYSFDSEKQNEPVNPAECLFREEDMTFWDDEFPTLEALHASMGNNGTFYGACDPSMGRAGRHGDDSALITILRHPATRMLYIVDADIERRSPDQTINNILQYQKLRRYRRFAFETNQLQEFMASELAKRSRETGHPVRVEEVKHQSDKVARIQSLQPLIKSGTIRFSRRHRTLLEQLRQFPKGAHDDGPDALEMAISIANTSTGWTLEAVRSMRAALEETRRPRIFDDQPPFDWNDVSPTGHGTMPGMPY